MKNFGLGIVGLFLASAPVFAGGGTVTIQANLEKAEYGFTQGRSGNTGEYIGTRNNQLIHFESVATEDLKVWNMKLDPLEDNKVLGVDVEGRWEGNLVRERGKYYWKVERELTLKDQPPVLLKNQYEVEFTEGTFAGFQKGDAVSFRMTKKGQEALIQEFEEETMTFLRVIRQATLKDHPKALITAKISKKEVKGEATFQGDSKGLDFVGPTVDFQATLKAKW